MSKRKKNNLSHLKCDDCGTQLRRCIECDTLYCPECDKDMIQGDDKICPDCHLDAEEYDDGCYEDYPLHDGG